MNTQLAMELRTIKLEPCPAAQLDSLLGRLIELLEDGPELTATQVVRGKLEDARWLATWLRDYVQVEVTRDEALDLSQVLVAILRKADLTESDERVCRQFLGCLQREGCVS